MKRIAILVFLLGFVISQGGLFTTPARAADAPKGTWLGSWPYVLPPDHTLNSFSSNGLDDNLGSLFKVYVELPFALYKWADDKYEGLLAEKWGFVDDNKAYQV